MFLFTRKVGRESARWEKAGIISAEQRASIIAFYRKKMSIPFPAILAVFAVILIGAGLILFYAANWKKMPPSLKLVQIFLLMAGAYGASWYFIFVKKSASVTTRALLLVAMITFGAGISLVAQVYHVSAHPSNGLLVWALGTLLVSAVVRESWGYFLSVIPFLIWNFWEFTIYQNPNYGFVLVPVILFFLFYREKNRYGTALSALLLLVWYFQFTGHIIQGQGDRGSALIGILAFLPLGGILFGLHRYLAGIISLDCTAAVLKFSGIIAVTVPLLTLSWPYDFKEHYLLFGTGTIVPSVMLLSFTLILGVMTAINYRTRREFIPLAVIFIISVIGIVLPLGIKGFLLSYTHLAIFVVSGGLFLLLLDSEIVSSSDRIAAMLVFGIFILAKAAGFGAMAERDGSVTVAYLTGSNLFLVIMYVVLRIIGNRLGKKGRPIDAQVPELLVAAAVATNLFVLSFRLKAQVSLFDSPGYVIVLACMFVILSLAGFLYLWRMSAEKIPVILPGVVFIVNSVVLFTAGPWFSWIVYSLVFNFLLIGYAITLLYYSTVIGSRFLANGAILLFILHVGTRYFDLFWDMLSGSFLFIITGLFFLAGGWLIERNRKKILAQIEAADGRKK